MKTIDVKSVNHYTRRDYTTTCTEASMTDQSGAIDSDINTIVSRYRLTGIPPETRNTVQQFLDCTIIPNFQSARDQIANANSLFQQLPSAIRAQMDNDPAKAEQYLTDPKNLPILEKHGLVTITQQDLPPKAPVEPSTPPQAPTQTDSPPS